MIIDFHTHIFPPEIIENRSMYIQEQEWFSSLYGDSNSRMVSAEGLVEEMDRCGVERAVACGFAWDSFDLYVRTNDYIAEAVSRYPGRLIGFANVPPLHPEAPAELERCAALGLGGLGELKAAGQGFDLDNPGALRPVAEVAARHEMPLLVHISEPVGKQYPGKGFSSPRKGYRLALEYPELKLIYAHWGGGLLFYELMPDVRQELANVYYDCSANPYLYDRSIFALSMSLPIRDKMLFGSDYPLLRLEDCIGEIQEVGLSETDYSALMRGNAESLLKEMGLWT